LTKEITDYQKLIAISKYARFREDLGRRETWEETVDRYFDYFGEYLEKRCNFSIPDNTVKELTDSIENMDIFPSMRALMMAGPALRKCGVGNYNCSFTPVNNPRVFDEALYILCCGTGLGFSVERQEVQKLPEVAEDFHDTDTTIFVHDSKIGWAKSFRELISMLYAGQVPKVDYSSVRPKGAILKTTGGRASGPEPLEDLFKFCILTFKGAAGRKLTSLEVHDIMCKIGEIVVQGSVRRSALISLSNLSDLRMRDAKSGQWWIENPQRSLANNSVAYTEKPEVGMFMDEWKSLYDSKSGERGIFNREAAVHHLETAGIRDTDNISFGNNPCSEIILRPQEFCNLTCANIRSDDTWDDIKKKVEQATILGTIQASVDNFKYLRKKWSDNVDEERLLGVSLSGIYDNPLTWIDYDVDPDWQDKEDILAKNLTECYNIVKKTNKEWSKKLGINSAAGLTCIKPSGNSSQLADMSSGIHPRFSPYYMRSVRLDVKDPVSRVLIDSGMPYEVDEMNPSSLVFSFPQKSPIDSGIAKGISAINQLRLWKIYFENWTDHTVSATIYVREHEWLEVGAWVYKHFDDIVGLSFLPYTEHTYKQAPYIEVDKETYEQALSSQPKIKWDLLGEYEKEDMTESSHELACTGNKCEI